MLAAAHDYFESNDKKRLPSRVPATKSLGQKVESEQGEKNRTVATLDVLSSYAICPLCWTNQSNYYSSIVVDATPSQTMGNTSTKYHSTCCRN